MLFSAIILIVILLFSAILHEIAHGFVADRLGDPTARLMGRLSLNPRKHIDPFMSILLPLMLIVSGSPVIFGAAKPVPVDPFNLKEGRKDLALVSISGPLTNVIIAIIGATIVKLILYFSVNPGINPITPFLTSFFYSVVQINLLLAIFNMLPIPPLDGSKVFALLLPEKKANSYLAMGSLGLFVLFFLLIFPIGGFSISDVIFRLLIFSQQLLGL